MNRITTVFLSIWRSRRVGNKLQRAKLLIAYLMALLVSAPLFAQDAAWQRSYSLEAVGQYAQAAQLLEPFLGSAADAEFAQLRSGWLYYLDGNYSRSIKHYQTALKLNTSSLEAQLGLSLPLLAQQRWREAALHCKAVIAESKWNYYAHLRLMVAEEGMQLWDTLIEHSRALTARYPADPGFFVYLARAYQHKGDTNKAREAYSQVLVRMPQHVEATQYLSKQN